MRFGPCAFTKYQNEDRQAQRGKLRNPLIAGGFAVVAAMVLPALEFAG